VDLGDKMEFYYNEEVSPSVAVRTELNSPLCTAHVALAFGAAPRDKITSSHVVQLKRYVERGKEKEAALDSAPPPPPPRRFALTTSAWNGRLCKECSVLMELLNGFSNLQGEENAQG
jgi:hypothetical protein